jgi:hypothetical protein
MRGRFRRLEIEAGMSVKTVEEPETFGDYVLDSRTGQADNYHACLSSRGDGSGYDLNTLRIVGVSYGGRGRSR